MKRKRSLGYWIRRNSKHWPIFLIYTRKEGRQSLQSFIFSDKILVFCDSIFALEELERVFKKPILQGKTTSKTRKDVLTKFRQTQDCNIVFLSKIGDTSIDLPEATVLIQIQGQEGSRRQEAQRLGRILRPKIGMPAGTQAFFYTLISRDTKVSLVFIHDG